MKSSGMKWIIPAVIVAIAALIAFQINWLIREAEMKKQDEQRRVAEAIRASCVAMEDQFTRRLIGGSLDSLMDSQQFIVRDSVHIEQNGDSIRQVVIINDIDSITNIEDHSVPPHPLPPPLPPAPPQWISEDSANIIVMRRAENARNAIEDVMMEYVFSSGMPGNLDTTKLDSILRNKLSEAGINYDYSREVKPGRRKAIRPFDSLGEWQFHSKIFEADPSPFGPELVVTIHPGNTSGIMRVLPQLIFSVLITVGMLILFLLIYREAKRQKKIGDIRRDFINNMTHEFKTPLATMSLAADTIMNEKVIGDKDKVKYYAEQIKSENKKLNLQVEKVLELALTEKTGVLMNKERLNLTEVVLRAMKSMELQVADKVGILELVNDQDVILIDADAFHLERVFVNLIDNALKYGGSPPRISLSIVTYRSGTEIKITDNGSGIPSSDWSLIFEPFHRVSTGDVHNVKGFGLGLSYTRSVIAEHNGSISVTKSDKSGTTLTVIIKHNP
jgi:signal transduction histidine kinase